MRYRRAVSLLTRAVVVIAIVATPALAHAQDEPSDTESTENGSDTAGEDTSKSSENGTDETEHKHKHKRKHKHKHHDEDADENADEHNEGAFGHMGQWGLRAGLVGGMHVIFRRNNKVRGMPYCTEPDLSKGDPSNQQANCGFVAPLAAELALSFAPLDFVEPYIYTRLGFVSEKDTNTDPLTMFGIGVRLYTMSDSAFKIFIEPGLAVETEGGGDNPIWRYNGAYTPNYRTDLIFHAAVGGHYDFSKNVGMFLNFFTVDVGVLRYIQAYLIWNLGVQGRLP